MKDGLPKTRPYSPHNQHSYLSHRQVTFDRYSKLDREIDKLSDMMSKRLLVIHPVPPINPTYIKEEEVKVTVIEGGSSSDIDHIVEKCILIDHLKDKTSEEITLEEATKVIKEERYRIITEVIKITIKIKTFVRRNTMSMPNSPKEIMTDVTNASNLDIMQKNVQNKKSR